MGTLPYLDNVENSSKNESLKTKNIINLSTRFYLIGIALMMCIPFVTNGNSYSYDVNLLPERYYVITITSVDDGYIGALET